MKKTFTLFFALVFAIFCKSQTPWNGTVAESYDGGDGTPENPYQIATAEQLALLAYQTNNGNGGDAYYVLVNDIDLNGSGGQEWNPIGTVKSDWTNPINPGIVPAYPFTGVFDGNNHIVSDLYVNDNDVLGLFGCIQNAEVKNVSIEGQLVLGSYMGFVVGLSFDSNISDCTASGTIQAYGHKVGGIVGHFVAKNIGNDTVFVKNCINNANISEGVFSLGGIAGYTTMENGNVVIKNCVNNGEIGEVSNTSFAGGMVGEGDFILRNCHNYGKIYATSCAGGMVGQGGNFGLIQGCVNHESGEIRAEFAGGIIGTAIFTVMSCCGNEALITGYGHDSLADELLVGGISGADGTICNCYNRGDLTAVFNTSEPLIAQIGGIASTPPSDGQVRNVYNTGTIIKPSNPNIQSASYSHIVPATLNETLISNCYWIGNETISPDIYDIATSSWIPIPYSSAFNPGASATSWMLDEAQYGTTDLLEALNAGAMGECVWVEDTEGINGGFPIPMPIYHDAVDENQGENNVLAFVYPNPGNNILNIRTDLSTPELYVYDIFGRIVHYQQLTEISTLINTESWPSGMYIWKVISNGIIAESGKWLKSH